MSSAAPDTHDETGRRPDGGSAGHGSAAGRPDRTSGRAPGRRPVGLFAGLVVVDVIQLVEAPPGPDEKIVAHDQAVAAGGPACNAAVAFAALGGSAELAAPVGGGPLGGLVRADLSECGVGIIDCLAPEVAGPGSGLSVSSCTVTASTGERSVVSTNGRAPVDPAPLLERLRTIDDGSATAPDVVLIDGHNPVLAEIALEVADRHRIVSVMDAGSWKDSAAHLLGRCDVVAPSARFAPPGTDPADHGAVADWLLRAGTRAVVITQGAGPVLWWCQGEHGAVEPPSTRVVDTLGAGDVFHGALAHALAGRDRSSGGIAPADLVEAIAAAARTAALSTASFGTRGWLRSMMEA